MRIPYRIDGGVGFFLFRLVTVGTPINNANNHQKYQIRMEWHINISESMQFCRTLIIIETTNLINFISWIRRIRWIIFRFHSIVIQCVVYLTSFGSFSCSNCFTTIVSLRQFKAHIELNIWTVVGRRPYSIQTGIKCRGRKKWIKFNEHPFKRSILSKLKSFKIGMQCKCKTLGFDF